MQFIIDTSWLRTQLSYILSKSSLPFFWHNYFIKNLKKRDVMVVVIRKEDLGAQAYRAAAEMPDWNRKSRLNSGNDFSYGDAREVDARELEREKKKPDNKERSLLSRVLNFFSGRRDQKVLDKRHAKHLHGA